MNIKQGLISTEADLWISVFDSSIRNHHGTRRIFMRMIPYNHPLLCWKHLAKTKISAQINVTKSLDYEFVWFFAQLWMKMGKLSSHFKPYSRHVQIKSWVTSPVPSAYSALQCIECLTVPYSALQCLTVPYRVPYSA